MSRLTTTRVPMPGRHFRDFASFAPRREATSIPTALPSTDPSAGQTAFETLRAGILGGTQFAQMSADQKLAQAEQDFASQQYIERQFNRERANDARLRAQQDAVEAQRQAQLNDQFALGLEEVKNSNLAYSDPMAALAAYDEKAAGADTFEQFEAAIKGRGELVSRAQSQRDKAMAETEASLVGRMSDLADQAAFEVGQLSSLMRADGQEPTTAELQDAYRASLESQLSDIGVDPSVAFSSQAAVEVMEDSFREFAQAQSNETLKNQLAATAEARAVAIDSMSSFMARPSQHLRFNDHVQVLRGMVESQYPGETHEQIDQRMLDQYVKTAGFVAGGLVTSAQPVKDIAFLNSLYDQLNGDPEAQAEFTSTVTPAIEKGIDALYTDSIETEIRGIRARGDDPATVLSGGTLQAIHDEFTSAVEAGVDGDVFEGLILDKMNTTFKSYQSQYRVEAEKVDAAASRYTQISRASGVVRMTADELDSSYTAGIYHTARQGKTLTPSQVTMRDTAFRGLFPSADPTGLAPGDPRLTMASLAADAQMYRDHGLTMPPAMTKDLEAMVDTGNAGEILNAYTIYHTAYRNNAHAPLSESTSAMMLLMDNELGRGSSFIAGAESDLSRAQSVANWAATHINDALAQSIDSIEDVEKMLTRVSSLKPQEVADTLEAVGDELARRTQISTGWLNDGQENLASILDSMPAHFAQNIATSAYLFGKRYNVETPEAVGMVIDSIHRNGWKVLQTPDGTVRTYLDPHNLLGDSHTMEPSQQREYERSFWEAPATPDELERSGTGLRPGIARWQVLQEMTTEDIDGQYDSDTMVLDWAGANLYLAEGMGVPAAINLDGVPRQIAGTDGRPLFFFTTEAARRNDRMRRPSIYNRPVTAEVDLYPGGTAFAQ